MTLYPKFKSYFFIFVFIFCSFCLFSIQGCSKKSPKTETSSSKKSSEAPGLHLKSQLPPEVPTREDLVPSVEKVGEIADQARIHSEIYKKIQTPSTGIDEVIRIEKIRLLQQDAQKQQEILKRIKQQQDLNKNALENIHRAEEYIKQTQLPTKIKPDTASVSKQPTP